MEVALVAGAYQIDFGEASQVGEASRIAACLEGAYRVVVVTQAGWEARVYQLDQ